MMIPRSADEKMMRILSADIFLLKASGAVIESPAPFIDRNPFKL